MAKKPQLIILCQMFFPELVSTGQTMTELAEELAGKGVELEVWCAQPTLQKGFRAQPKRMTHKGILVRRLWSTRFSKLLFLGKLLNHLSFSFSVFFALLFERSKRPFLVLTNPPMMAPIVALFRKRFIYLLFDLYPETAIQAGFIRQHGLTAKIWRWANRFSYSRAAHIVVLGRCMRQRVEKEISAANAKKIRMIHVWSDDAAIGEKAQGENPFLERWKLKGKFVAAYSGNMARFHDMETIMAAAERFRHDPSFEFVFVGDGQKKEWMIEFARQKHLANCQFHDYVERAELPQSLRVGQIGLVALCNGHEGLSVPSKTYALMAAGVPVVAVVSEDSEIALMIREEKCGCVVKPGDVDGLVAAITMLRQNKNLLPMMGQNGRNAIAKKYNLLDAAEKYLELISA